MRRLATAPWLAILGIGLLTGACTLAGQNASRGSRDPSPLPSAPALGGPTPTARPTVPSTPGAELLDARIPKERVQGVAPEDAPVVFEEVGLRVGQNVSYSLTSDASASYQCRNPKTAAVGMQHETVKRRVTAAPTLTVGPGGSIRSILVLRLPPPARPSCSRGFRAVAYAGTYDRVLLADTTNDLQVDLGSHQFIAD